MATLQVCDRCHATGTVIKLLGFDIDLCVSCEAALRLFLRPKQRHTPATYQAGRLNQALDMIDSVGYCCPRLLASSNGEAGHRTAYYALMSLRKRGLLVKRGSRFYRPEAVEVVGDGK
jgi:hypothetical protein